MKVMAIAYRAIATASLTVSTSSPAMAQSTHTDSVAQANAQKMWGQVPPPVQRCVNLMFSSKKVAVDQIAKAGIAPNDQRIAPAIDACNQYLAAQPRTNFPCTVSNSKGEQVATTCSESYAKEINGSLIPISGDEMLVAAGSGEKVVSGNFETLEAHKARLAQEQIADSTNEPQIKSTIIGSCSGFYSFLKQDDAFSIEIKSDLVKYVGIDFTKFVGEKTLSPNGDIGVYFGETGLTSLRCNGKTALIKLSLPGWSTAREYRLVKTQGDIFKYAQSAGWIVGE